MSLCMYVCMYVCMYDFSAVYIHCQALFRYFFHYFSVTASIMIFFLLYYNFLRMKACTIHIFRKTIRSFNNRSDFILYYIIL